MRVSVIAMGMGLVLAGCADPLANLPKIGDVELSQSDAAAAALPSDAEVAREGFIGTQAASPETSSAIDAAVAQAAGAATTPDAAAPETAVALAPAPADAEKPGGLLGLLRRAVPRGGSDDPAPSDTTAIAEAVATTQTDVPDPAQTAPTDATSTQLAALTPPADAAAPAPAVQTEPAPKRRGLLGRMAAPAKDQPRTGPDAREVSYGTVLPFGTVARVCDAKGKSLGRRVEKAPAKGFSLYDSAQGTAGARTWYITGFADGCPRQLTGANVLIGSASRYEQLHFGPGGDNLPYRETDRAYEGVKRKVCGARKGKPCGAKISKMEKSTFFISAYPRFGNSSRWAELLIHDGEVLATATKPN